MELAKNKSMALSLCMALEAFGSRTVESILRLVIPPKSFESPSSCAAVKA
jgi:hypothetical protein